MSFSLQLSFAHKVALLVTLPVTGFLLYLLLRKDEEDYEPPKREVVTSRHRVIEVQVPQHAAGVIIGPQGSQIKKIQETTGARVNFKDDSEAKGDVRVVIVRGTDEQAQQAELMIRKILADIPPIIEEVFYVHQRVLGRIIGKNGETVRNIQRISRTRVKIDRNPTKSEMKEIVISGVAANVVNAKGMIEEKIEEDDVFRAKMSVNAANRPSRSTTQQQGRGHVTTVSGSKQENQGGGPIERGTGPLPPFPTTTGSVAHPSPPGAEGQQSEWPKHRPDYFEVYVSAVEHPGHFWVQVISPESVKLDRLLEEMTKYYSIQPKMPFTTDYPVGVLVAAPFAKDRSYYRARVEEIQGDKVDLYFVDFGDSELVDKSDVFPLRSDHLNLPFQAFECCLAEVEPAGNAWSEEAIIGFEELVHVAKWKVVMCKTLAYRATEDDEYICVQLVDTNTSQDRDVASDLVSHGHARYRDISEASAATCGQVYEVSPQADTGYKEEDTFEVDHYLTDFDYENKDYYFYTLENEAVLKESDTVGRIELDKMADINPGNDRAKAKGFMGSLLRLDSYFGLLTTLKDPGDEENLNNNCETGCDGVSISGGYGDWGNDSEHRSGQSSSLQGGDTQTVCKELKGSIPGNRGKGNVSERSTSASYEENTRSRCELNCDTTNKKGNVLELDGSFQCGRDRVVDVGSCEDIRFSEYNREDCMVTSDIDRVDLSVDLNSQLCTDAVNNTETSPKATGQWPTEDDAICGLQRKGNCSHISKVDLLESAEKTRVSSLLQTDGVDLLQSLSTETSTCRKTQTCSSSGELDNEKVISSTKVDSDGYTDTFSCSDRSSSLKVKCDEKVRGQGHVEQNVCALNICGRDIWASSPEESVGILSGGRMVNSDDSDRVAIKDTSVADVEQVMCGLDTELVLFVDDLLQDVIDGVLEGCRLVDVSSKGEMGLYELVEEEVGLDLVHDTLSEVLCNFATMNQVPDVDLCPDTRQDKTVQKPWGLVKSEVIVTISHAAGLTEVKADLVLQDDNSIKKVSKEGELAVWQQDCPDVSEAGAAEFIDRESDDTKFPECITLSRYVADSNDTCTRVSDKEELYLDDDEDIRFRSVKDLLQDTVKSSQSGYNVEKNVIRPGQRFDVDSDGSGINPHVVLVTTDVVARTTTTDQASVVAIENANTVTMENSNTVINGCQDELINENSCLMLQDGTQDYNCLDKCSENNNSVKTFHGDAVDEKQAEVSCVQIVSKAFAKSKNRADIESNIERSSGRNLLIENIVGTKDLQKNDLFYMKGELDVLYCETGNNQQDIVNGVSCEDINDRDMDGLTVVSESDCDLQREYQNRSVSQLGELLGTKDEAQSVLNSDDTEDVLEKGENSTSVLHQSEEILASNSVNLNKLVPEPKHRLSEDTNVCDGVGETAIHEDEREDSVSRQSASNSAGLVFVEKGFQASSPRSVSAFVPVHSHLTDREVDVILCSGVDKTVVSHAFDVDTGAVSDENLEGSASEHLEEAGNEKRIDILLLQSVSQAFVRSNNGASNESNIESNSDSRNCCMEGIVHTEELQKTDPSRQSEDTSEETDSCSTKVGVMSQKYIDDRNNNESTLESEKDASGTGQMYLLADNVAAVNSLSDIAKDMNVLTVGLFCEPILQNTMTNNTSNDTSREECDMDSDSLYSDDSLNADDFEGGVVHFRCDDYETRRVTLCEPGSIQGVGGRTLHVTPTSDDEHLMGPKNVDMVQPVYHLSQDRVALQNNSQLSGVMYDSLEDTVFGVTKHNDSYEQDQLVMPDVLLTGSGKLCNSNLEGCEGSYEDTGSLYSSDHRWGHCENMEDSLEEPAKQQNRSPEDPDEDQNLDICKAKHLVQGVHFVLSAEKEVKSNLLCQSDALIDSIEVLRTSSTSSGLQLSDSESLSQQLQDVVHKSLIGDSMDSTVFEACGQYVGSCETDFSTDSVNVGLTSEGESERDHCDMKTEGNGTHFQNRYDMDYLDSVQQLILNDPKSRTTSVSCRISGIEDYENNRADVGSGSNSTGDVLPPCALVNLQPILNDPKSRTVLSRISAIKDNDVDHANGRKVVGSGSNLNAVDFLDHGIICTEVTSQVPCGIQGNLVDHKIYRRGGASGGNSNDGDGYHDDRISCNEATGQVHSGIQDSLEDSIEGEFEGIKYIDESDEHTDLRSVRPVRCSTPLSTLQTTDPVRCSTPLSTVQATDTVRCSTPLSTVQATDPVRCSAPHGTLQATDPFVVEIMKMEEGNLNINNNNSNDSNTFNSLSESWLDSKGRQQEHNRSFCYSEVTIENECPETLTDTETCFCTVFEQLEGGKEGKELMDGVLGCVKAECDGISVRRDTPGTPTCKSVLKRWKHLRHCPNRAPKIVHFSEVSVTTEVSDPSDSDEGSERGGAYTVSEMTDGGGQGQETQAIRLNMATFDEEETAF